MILVDDLMRTMTRCLKMCQQLFFPADWFAWYTTTPNARDVSANGQLVGKMN